MEWDVTGWDGMMGVRFLLSVSEGWTSFSGLPLFLLFSF